MANARSFFTVLLTLILASAACTTATPTAAPTVPAPTLTLRFSTHVGPLVRETLPPTWTFTPTPTASATPTPTPVTPTATLTPIPDAADLCASVTADAPIPYGYPFAWENTLTVMLGTPLTAVRAAGTLDGMLVVRFLATNVLTGKNQGVEVPGGQVAVVEMPLHRLPGPGLYTWKIAVYGKIIGERCAQTGLFLVAPPNPAAATPEATPTAEAGTAEVTAAVTPADEAPLPVFDASILTALAPPAAP